MTTSNSFVVPANDFQQQWQEIRDTAMSVFDTFGQSGWYILGEQVSEFESALGKYWGPDFLAVGCGNGLDGLELALRVLELKSGEKVLTTPFSAFATTLAITRAGGVPVFVDTDSNGQVDLELAEEYLNQHPEVRFFIPVHLYGQPLDLDRLERIQNSGVEVIEDCAQAIGTQFHGRPVGSSSRICATSFYPTKNLGALGDAGAVISREQSLIDRVKSLRNYGQTQKYHHEYLGSNSRLDELHAAILLQCLIPGLDDKLAKRREVADRYHQGIDNPDIRPVQSVDSGSTYHLYPVLVSDQASFLQHLHQHKIEANVHYPITIPDQPAMKQTYYEVAGSLEKSRYVSSHIVSLPIHPHLNQDQVQAVISACNDWLA